MLSTPRSDRLHIGIFGKRNSGKSSLINAFTNQNTAIVSDVPGTTADPVYKSMEISGIGACVLIDTAGFDDIGELGSLRVEKTKIAAEKTDIAIILVSNNNSDIDIDSDDNFDIEAEWAEYFDKMKTPYIYVINKSDLLDYNKIAESLRRKTGKEALAVSSKTKEGIQALFNAVLRLLPEDFEGISITGGLVKEGDVVLLVMPQDIQAPKGRLILPQVQTIRELLDKKCVIISSAGDKLNEALSSLKNPPDLIITDSQLFRQVFEKKPEISKLTSFSVLFAAYKGDITYFAESAAAIEALTENSRVLIAEACTHAPLAEDIGRVKIPRLLRNKTGNGLQIDIKSGTDFPEDLSVYDLIIHCGACMFNRKYVMSRLAYAKLQKVPMSNYGIVMAYLTGIRVGNDRLAYVYD